MGVVGFPSVKPAASHDQFFFARGDYPAVMSHNEQRSRAAPTSDGSRKVKGCVCVCVPVSGWYRKKRREKKTIVSYRTRRRVQAWGLGCQGGGGAGRGVGLLRSSVAV